MSELVSPMIRFCIFVIIGVIIFGCISTQTNTNKNNTNSTTNPNKVNTNSYFKCANGIYSSPGSSDALDVAGLFINGSNGEIVARCGGNIKPINPDNCRAISATCDYSKPADNVPSAVHNPREPDNSSINPKTLGISLCTDIDYGGGCETFLVDAPDLRNNQIGNDQASSVIVPDGGVVSLFEHINYDGACETFTFDDPDLRDNAIGNDCVSSLVVGSSCPSDRVGFSGENGCKKGNTITDWRATQYYLNCGQCNAASFSRIYPDKSVSSYSMCYDDYLACVNNGCGKILDNCR